MKKFDRLILTILMLLGFFSGESQNFDCATNDTSTAYSYIGGGGCVTSPFLGQLVIIQSQI